MTFTKAVELRDAGKLKDGDIIKWQGIWNSDAKCWDGGYLYILKNGGFYGQSIHGVRNRKAAIAKYRAGLDKPGKIM